MLTALRHPACACQQRRLSGPRATPPEFIDAGCVYGCVLRGHISPERKRWDSPCFRRRGIPLLVDVGLEEAGQTVEIAAALDISDNRDKRVRVDQFLKGHIVQVELA